MMTLNMEHYCFPPSMEFNNRNQLNSITILSQLLWVDQTKENELNALK